MPTRTSGSTMNPPVPPFTLDDVELTRHPERAVTVNRITSGLALLGTSALLGAVAAAITSAVSLVAAKSRDWHDLYAWWDHRMALVALVPVLLYAWRWNRIKAAWQFRGYHLGDEELHIRSGLLFRSMTTLAYARIQEVEVESGPVQRRYNLATLVVRTAGGSGSLEDLDPGVAYLLRERLTELARERRFAA